MIQLITLDVRANLVSGERPTAVLEDSTLAAQPVWVAISSLLAPTVTWSQFCRGDRVMVPVFAYGPGEAGSSLVTALELGLRAQLALTRDTPVRNWENCWFVLGLSTPGDPNVYLGVVFKEPRRI